MAAPTIYNDVADDLNIGGQLFAGKKFFVVQRVPSRHRLLDDIKANGGEIVTLEKNADYIIADHLLPKFCPAGAISYEFVDKSIQDGVLRDPEDHPAGPRLGEAREPGAINWLAKAGRKAYTAEDDRMLYKWVRDCEANGQLSSGNEIYKRLEAESWRDRYIKRLKNRPPSAFNGFDNTPPSPRSDPSNQHAPPEASSSRPTQQPAHDGIVGKARTKDEYSLEDLARLFSTVDWEELYAFVDLIESTSIDKRSGAWTAWAASQDKQTVEQWLQYYEKVVRPQWERDPEWKRQQIKKKVEEKYKQDDSQSEDASQQQRESQTIKGEATTAQEQPPRAADRVSSNAKSTSEEPLQDVQKSANAEVGKSEQVLLTKQSHSTAAAYIYYVRAMESSVRTAQPDLDHTELHRVLMRQWTSLSDEEKAPYIAMDERAKTHRAKEIAKFAKTPSEIKLMSSSTTRHESPIVLKQTYETAMKRVRSHGAIEEHKNETEEIVRPSKRRRSDGAILNVGQKAALSGTPEQPLELSSQYSETSDSRNTEDRIEEQIVSDMAYAQDSGSPFKNEDLHDPDIATESIESDESINIDDQTLLPDDTEEDTPVNSPTPRASRYQKSLYDTQTILSSPTRDVSTQDPLPQEPIRKNKIEAEADPRSSSPLAHHISDVSTPPSIQEFRRSLNNEDHTHLFYPETRPSTSPAPSSTSSTGSGDPDPPLTAAELDLFFQEQYEEGFGNDFITTALKRTRMRPMLAIEVLEAWAQGKPLPDKRGIWTASDDEDVESGDGVALDRLARKHSVDGWGGITERMVFLEGYRSR
ncbi:hypothetical protein LEMA_P112310.1 [Plenodomus lingam JN3]|uniref:DNA-binding protein RAP1 n=1 Tax=Leptosphaeria maculans (strain JN3 / isolate v23.1.3 / race Av1-4-5-6-7-8) TaxID=985895 RepID=E4ZY67_LEPMJ|nr:hypothetical protein LEMA_P112310.1 [Plenodomus lingam JN3]CBX96312.1 hypothetical protein LEMA_P112310.1 [Plenodomus lingam JN3]